MVGHHGHAKVTCAERRRQAQGAATYAVRRRIGRNFVRVALREDPLLELDGAWCLSVPRLGEVAQ